MSFELIEKLRDKGYKITRQRNPSLQFSVKKGINSFLPGRSSKGIENGGCTNFSTVYRNPELLMQEGIVRKVELNRDAACYELQLRRTPSPLVCTKCGTFRLPAIVPWMNCRMRDGFVPTEHHFEIYGYCKDCV